jgi:hypothetical protein
MNARTKTYLIGGVTIASVITGFILYKKWRNKQVVTSAVKNVSTGTIKTLGINIPTIASQIGIELGTAFSAIDPRHWTENDAAAKELVLKVPKPLIKTLISEYYKKYKRNLQDDLQRLLDDYKDVAYLFE